MKCPACNKVFGKPEKTWKYREFKVEAYNCECGASFREYTRSGKHSFSLKRTKNDKRWIKA